MFGFSNIYIPNVNTSMRPESVVKHDQELSVVGIYHKKCNDGSMSAAVLKHVYPDIDLYSLQYNYNTKTLIDIVQKYKQGSILYIVDFSLKEEDYDIVCSHFGHVINIDHHLGAKDKLERVSHKYSNFEYLYEENESGATLTYIYFYGRENIPYLLRYTKDRDLWKFEYGEVTHYANEFISANIENISLLSEVLFQENQDYIEIGKHMYSLKKSLIDNFVKSYKPISVQIQSHEVLLVNTPFFHSEIAHEILAKYKKPVCVFYFTTEYNISLSFRSDDSCSITALELAKLFGGSGHKHASGAFITTKDPVYQFIFGKIN